MSCSKVKDATVCMTLTQNSVKKAVKSYTMSKRYITQTVRAGMINILYNRLIWNENEFLTKMFNGVPFKIFKSKSKNVLVRECHAHLKACREAFEKDYLKEMHLFFVDTISKDILEYYKFGFQYATESVPNTPKNSEDLTELTTDFLKTLNSLGEHDKLDNVEVQVELFYYPETPDDYEPPGFEGFPSSQSLTEKIKKKSGFVRLGGLNTGFHMLKCKAKGALFTLDNASDQKSVKNLEMDKIIQKIDKEAFTDDFSQYTEENVIDLTTAPSNEPEDFNPNDTYISAPLTDGSTEVIDFEECANCQCKLPEIELPIDIIQCVKCQQKYHAPCQGYLNKSFIINDFYCVYCKDATSNQNESSFFNVFNVSICRVRYLLACIYNFGALPDNLSVIFESSINKIKSIVNESNLASPNASLDPCINLFLKLFRCDDQTLIMDNCRKYFQTL